MDLFARMPIVKRTWCGIGHGAAIVVLLGLSGCGKSDGDLASAPVAEAAGSSFDAPVAAKPASPTVSENKTIVVSAAPAAQSSPPVTANNNTGALATPAPVNEAARQQPDPVKTEPVKSVDSAKIPDIASIPSATPVPRVSTPAPTAVPQASPSATGEAGLAIGFGDYKPMSFKDLSAFKYEEPIPKTGEKPEEVESRRPKNQIPDTIIALNGKMAAVEGWMVPMQVDDDGGVKSFVLVKTQPACCFGDTQKMNEWIDVTMPSGKKAEFNVDRPITVYGKLEVGEKTEDGFVLSIYRMAADLVKG